ncbi:MAG: methyltransferase domain-containing protein [Candidatus Omnitrophota bacterium]
MNNQTNDPIAEFYDRNPENEWNRLFVTPYRQIEFEVIHYFWNRYLPPQGKILDLGGGPGRLTISLAKKGYKVSLVDISPANIEWARKKIAGCGAAENVENLIVADARRLPMFHAETFDAVLCMGPLYHLVDHRERLQCLRECARIMKPDAPLFVTLLPRWKLLRDALRAGEFEKEAELRSAALEEILQRGYSNAAQIPPTYFCHPGELAQWFAESGFHLLKMASCHGFASFVDEKVNAIARNASAWQSLIRWVLDSCDDPEALSSAEHLLGIGKKRINPFM